MKTVVTILQLLCGLAIILIVLFQSGKSQGLSGAIGGVADSFLAKNKAKTKRDACGRLFFLPSDVESRGSSAGDTGAGFTIDAVPGLFQ